MSAAAREHDSFSAFYPAYLSEHAHRGCRELHFIGATLSLLFLGALLITGDFWWLAAALLADYGFAWVGNAEFEKEQPISFRHPFYSLISAWVMYWQMLTGQTSF